MARIARGMRGDVAPALGGRGDQGRDRLEMGGKAVNRGGFIGKNPDSDALQGRLGVKGPTPSPGRGQKGIPRPLGPPYRVPFSHTPDI